jgi:hypothetical protein
VKDSRDAAPPGGGSVDFSSPPGRPATAYRNARSETPEMHPDGWVLPRLETRRGIAADSLGPEASKWIDDSGVLGPGNALRPWQRYVLDRALEVDERGELLHPTVVLTVARQVGKSWLLRALGWWRLHQEPRFGEKQTILHVANRASTAREAWEPAARLAEEVYSTQPGARRRNRVAEVRYSVGREMLAIPGDSRWLIQAATANSGVGFSITMAIVDEAWNVQRYVVESAISPTMIARTQPQLFLVSTAGDSSSDLLRAYRDQALASDDSGILLLEWSAPPEAPYDEPATWRWASPELDDRRETFLRSRVAAMPSAEFRTQFVNQWVVAANGWLPAEAWAACGIKRMAEAKQADDPVVAFEVSQRDQRVVGVMAWRRGEKVAVSSIVFPTVEKAWQWARPRKARLLLPPELAVHFPGDRRRVATVGARELRTLLGGVERAVLDRRVVYRSSDELLTNHVLTAAAVANADGSRSLSTKASPGPIEAARCLVWSVGEMLKPASAKPVIVFEPL